MISDDFFLNGNNTHDWHNMLADLLYDESDEIVYGLQRDTWEELRQDAFEDITSPAYVYMKHLLAMCVNSIETVIGKTLSIDTVNNGRASSLMVDGQEIYGRRELNGLLNEQSGMNNYRRLLIEMKTANQFSPNDVDMAELIERGVKETIINHRLSNAEIGALALDGLPCDTLDNTLRNAIGAASFIKSVVQRHLKDKYAGQQIVIENDGVAINLALVGEDTHRYINSIETIIELTNKS